jgi:hypothetical protein
VTEAAIFFVSEAKFGILPPVIGSDIVNAVGERQARRLPWRQRALMRRMP